MRVRVSASLVKNVWCAGLPLPPSRVDSTLESRGLPRRTYRTGPFPFAVSSSDFALSSLCDVSSASLEPHPRAQDPRRPRVAERQGGCTPWCTHDTSAAGAEAPSCVIFMSQVTRPPEDCDEANARDATAVGVAAACGRHWRRSETGTGHCRVCCLLFD